jgi:ubiquinone/menaquinone biosynthesis C-methylase UbiE
MLRDKYIEVQPYEKLAPIYDFVMNHVDYVGWARYVMKIYEHFSLNVKTVLDISCGTGTLVKNLREIGFLADGCDYSEAMLEIAREKNPTANFWQSDSRDIKINQKYDSALCLYDSINYILDINDVTVVLESVEKILKDDAIFIFDICTEKNSLENFDSYYEKESINEYRYIRKSYYKRREKFHINEFRIKTPDGKFLETHKQKIYKIEDIRKVIASSPFELKLCLDGFTFRPATESSSERVHFILFKKLR